MKREDQTSSTVFLVRPASFGFHAEAARSNAFARASADPDVRSTVRREFDALAQRLADADVEVLIADDPPEPAKPDAVFPNNWVSFHADGTIALYPMATAARRLERNADELKTLLESSGFEIRRIVDLSGSEHSGRYLEGTGSLILDRANGRAYASLSPRTDPAVIAEFDAQLGYSTHMFDARDRSGQPIYHTNVLMSLGTHFALLCVEAVAPEDRAPLIDALEASGRTLVEVDYEQLGCFACNIIELRRRTGEPIIALSSAAKASLLPDQVRWLETLGGELVDAPIPTIEAVGGGSVRCMIADVHLPRA